MVTLPEVVYQVDEAKFRQNVGDKLSAQVLGLIQVYVDISHQDGVLAPEALQGIIYIMEVGQSVWWEV